MVRSCEHDFSDGDDVCWRCGQTRPKTEIIAEEPLPLLGKGKGGNSKPIVPTKEVADLLEKSPSVTKEEFDSVLKKCRNTKPAKSWKPKKYKKHSNFKKGSVRDLTPEQKQVLLNDCKCVGVRNAAKEHNLNFNSVRALYASSGYSKPVVLPAVTPAAAAMRFKRSTANLALSILPPFEATWPDSVKCAWFQALGCIGGSK